jgi:hypothetical protein
MEAAEERNEELIAPKIGEPVILDGNITMSVSGWWAFNLVF